MTRVGGGSVEMASSSTSKHSVLGQAQAQRAELSVLAHWEGVLEEASKIKKKTPRKSPGKKKAAYAQLSPPPSARLPVAMDGEQNKAAVTGVSASVRDGISNAWMEAAEAAELERTQFETELTAP